MTYVALLRGINVGGKNKIRAADLRACAENAGFEEPRTLLNSGNVVFRSRRTSVRALGKSLSGAVHAHAGFTVAVVVLAAKELRRALASNPFAGDSAVTPNHLLIYFAQEASPEEAVTGAQRDYPGPERIAPGHGVVFVHYTRGIAGSKLDNTRLDRLLGNVGTMRNWNTASKLAALADEF